MQITIDLTPDQLLTVSQDLKAALPELLPTMLPTMLSNLLSDEGSREERKAYRTTLKDGERGSSYDNDRKAESYTTLRQTVINHIATKAVETLSKDPQLVAVAQSLAIYVQEHRKEVAAEAMARWFDEMWRHVASNAQHNHNRTSMLVEVLKERQILPLEACSKLFQQYDSMLGLRF